MKAINRFPWLSTTFGGIILDHRLSVEKRMRQKLYMKKKNQELKTLKGEMGKENPVTKGM